MGVESLEQEYFYLTAVDESDKYDAHQLKEMLNLRYFSAWNKGDIEEGNIRFNKTCLYISTKRFSSEDYLFYGTTITGLLKAPKDLKKTLHFVVNSSTECQSHGCYLQEEKLKKMALIDAGFSFYAKLHYLSRKHELPFSEYIEPVVCQDATKATGYAHFTIGAYHHTLDDISNKLGFKHNHRSFNFSDIRKSSKKPYGITSWDYKSSLDEQAPIAEHIESLVNELYPYKSQILAIGNEIDISYGMSVTGNMPNEYECHINKDTIRKLAEMRISLDFDMYFLNN